MNLPGGLFGGIQDRLGMGGWGQQGGAPWAPQWMQQNAGRAGSDQPWDWFQNQMQERFQSRVMPQQGQANQYLMGGLLGRLGNMFGQVNQMGGGGDTGFQQGTWAQGQQQPPQQQQQNLPQQQGGGVRAPWSGQFASPNPGQGGAGGLNVQGQFRPQPHFWGGWQQPQQPQGQGPGAQPWGL